LKINKHVAVLLQVLFLISVLTAINQDPRLRAISAAIKHHKLPPNGNLKKNRGTPFTRRVHEKFKSLD